ncbi:group II intron maturase-specific domain-containing protein [Peribacillus frigoritolerans]|uniref:Group II intron maturase-specific domain-containing protein n=1 Tax=Peribacillus frigoritolerans TaxID=450367 RepID=A0AAJ1QIC7_9BACI|nr:group II intron maturase-specific domain-containing protein [Peribacillus frigoritolerans]MDM5281933.1 group II intron maturase-specific domain-containing protein [Peribacillus frigoritolerans]
MKSRIRKLTQYLRGWIGGYFSLIDTPSVLKKLDS